MGLKKEDWKVDISIYRIGGRLQSYWLLLGHFVRKPLGNKVEAGLGAPGRLQSRHAAR